MFCVHATCISTSCSGRTDTLTLPLSQGLNDAKLALCQNSVPPGLGWTIYPVLSCPWNKSMAHMPALLLILLTFPTFNRSWHNLPQPDFGILARTAANNMLLFAYALKAPPREANLSHVHRTRPRSNLTAAGGGHTPLSNLCNMLSSKLSSPPLRCQMDSWENIPQSVSQHPDKYRTKYAMVESPGSKVPLSGLVLLPIFVVSNISMICRNYKEPPCLSLRLSVSWTMTRHFPLQFLQCPGPWSLASHLNAPPHQRYLQNIFTCTPTTQSSCGIAQGCRPHRTAPFGIVPHPPRPLSVLGPIAAFPSPVHSHAQTTSIQSPCIFCPHYIASLSPKTTFCSTLPHPRQWQANH